jgi:hypothetical protein
MMSESPSVLPQADAAQQVLGMGQLGLDAAADVQKEQLAICRQSGRAWAERVQTEFNFWSDAIAELAGARSGTEFLNLYSQCLGRRFRMAADDAQHLFQDWLNASQAPTRPFLSRQSH